MTKPIWECKNIHVRMGENLLLKDCSFQIQPQDRTVLIGKSGSGKSTLLRLILGLEIQWKGWKLEGEWTKRTSPIQIVFQDPFLSFNPRWKVERSLLEPFEVSLQTKMSRDDYLLHIKKEFSELFPNRDWREYSQKFPKELSGGELQRFAILRAFQTPSPLILLDEALSALDLHLQKETIEWVLQKQEISPLALVFVSHDFEFVERFSKKTIWMDQGQIVAQGSPKDVLKLWWEKESI